MDLVRAGLIGLGRHGSRYARHIINDVDGMELVGVAREDPSKGLPDGLKDACVEMVDDIEELLSRDVELLVVVTPTDSHFKLSEFIFSRLIHLLLRGDGLQIH